MAQSKVFAGTFAVGVVAEFIGELMLSSLIPNEKKNLKARFWARYVVEASVIMVVGVAGYTITNVLATNGYNTLSWLVAVFPILALLSFMITIQGVNTVLDTTSGVGCFGMVKAAIRERSKKKCSN